MNFTVVMLGNVFPRYSLNFLPIVTYLFLETSTSSQVAPKLLYA